MAPESLGEQRYSPKSDTWAFGVLCWEVTWHRSSCISFVLPCNSSAAFALPILRPHTCPVRVLRVCCLLTFNGAPNHRLRKVDTRNACVRASCQRHVSDNAPLRVAQICTCQMPWEGMALMNVAMAVCRDQRTLPVEDIPHEPLRKVVQQCWSYSPGTVLAVLVRARSPPLILYAHRRSALAPLCEQGFEVPLEIALSGGTGVDA